VYELGEPLEIAKVIRTEREVDRLLHLILEKSRFITGAAAGSIDVLGGHAISESWSMPRGRTMSGKSVFARRSFSRRRSCSRCIWTTSALSSIARVDAGARENQVEAQGRHVPLLQLSAVAWLSVARGPVTSAPIDEIRSHVVHTHKPLSRILWGKPRHGVAVIAGSYQERQSGTGYHRRLRAEENPLQSKMMRIRDIFDALTASDRSFKRPARGDGAGYARLEVKAQHVGADLALLFVAARVWNALVDGAFALSCRT
jgi:hypothetical protein